jgi:GNAT superfamily N-acetyltransferase
MPATADDDFRAVAQVYYTTWQATYPGLIPAAYLASLTPATWHPEKRWRQTFLAKVDGQPVGVCAFGPARAAEHQGMGELYSIYILPEYQGLGIGGALMRPAMARLDAQFAQSYLMVVAANAHAVSVYQHYGFQAVGGLHTIAVTGGDFVEQMMVRTAPKRKQ